MKKKVFKHDNFHTFYNAQCKNRILYVHIFYHVLDGITEMQKFYWYNITLYTATMPHRYIILYLYKYIENKF